MYNEEDLLPLSAISQYCFCPRRSALLHLEQLWDDNKFTAEGTIVHERVDELGTESRGDLRISRHLHLRSLRLGLSGIADIMEFQRRGDEVGDGDLALPGLSGRWFPFPIEYKRGKLRHEESFELQLCAQALCAEETWKIHIPKGAIYFAISKHRLEIVFTSGLRRKTEETSLLLHALVASGKTPPALYEKKCQSCSLYELCMPKITQGDKSVRGYLEREITANIR